MLKPAATRVFGLFNGTSMATPHVAGAAAFLFTKFPTATVAQIKDKILRSVDKKPSLTGKVLTGGRLNLYKAAADSAAITGTGANKVLTFSGPRRDQQRRRLGVRYRRGEAFPDRRSLFGRSQRASRSRIVAGAGPVSAYDNTCVALTTGRHAGSS